MVLRGVVSGLVKVYWCSWVFFLGSRRCGFGIFGYWCCLVFYSAGVFLCGFSWVLLCGWAWGLVIGGFVVFEIVVAEWNVLNLVGGWVFI